MTQVRSRAIGNPNHHRSGSPVPARALVCPCPPTHWSHAWRGGTGIRTRSPRTVDSHRARADRLWCVAQRAGDRYIAGRFAGLSTGRFLLLLLAATSGIAICRILAQLWSIAARYGEVGIGYLILGLGCWIGLSGLWRAIGLAVLIIAAYTSFSFPGYHFVVLTHLHNLGPVDLSLGLGRTPWAVDGTPGFPAHAGALDSPRAAADLARSGRPPDLSSARSSGEAVRCNRDLPRLPGVPGATRPDLVTSCRLVSVAAGYSRLRR